MTLYACQTQNVEMLKRLVEIIPIDDNCIYNHNGNIEIFKIILDNTGSHNWEIVARDLIKDNHLELFKMLLEEKKLKNYNEFYLDCIQYNRIEIVKYLLSIDIDFNKDDLIYACNANKVEIVRLFLEKKQYNVIEYSESEEVLEMFLKYFEPNANCYVNADLKMIYTLKGLNVLLTEDVFKKLIKMEHMDIMKTLKLFPELDKNNNEYVELATQVNTKIADHLCKNGFVVSDLAKTIRSIIKL